MPKYDFDHTDRQRLVDEIALEPHVHKQRILNAIDADTITPGDDTRIVVVHEGTCESVVKAGDEICDCDPNIYVSTRTIGAPTEFEIDADGLPI